jgi:hypothetical protein
LRADQVATDPKEPQNIEQGISNDEVLHSTFVGFRQSRIGQAPEQSTKPELTRSYARQSVVFPPSGDDSYLSIQPGVSTVWRR